MVNMAVLDSMILQVFSSSNDSDSGEDFGVSMSETAALPDPAHPSHILLSVVLRQADSKCLAPSSSALSLVCAGPSTGAVSVGITDFCSSCGR